MKTKLLLASLLLFGMASAQAPKIKRIYKDKVTYFGSEDEKQTEPINYCDYSPTGKLFTEKLYVQGQESVVREYYYNKKDSLIREVHTGFLVETDSTVYTYSSKYDTTLISDYYEGKVFHTLFTSYHKNGKKHAELEFWVKDSGGYFALYDTTGKLIHIKNSNEGIKYDEFGNMIAYPKDGYTIYWKYSDDGKYLIEYELFTSSAIDNYRYAYSYTKSGKLYKTVYFTNGYISKKSATSGMVYSDSMVIKNTYDKENNLITTKTYSKGTKLTWQTDYAYDDKHQKIKEQTCDGKGLCKELIAYTYDKYGNILKEIHWPLNKSGLKDWEYVYTYEFY